MDFIIDTIHFVRITCGGCGVNYAMTQKFFDSRKEDHQTFHCPNGCVRHFVGETKEDRLRRELRNAHRQADQLRQEAQKNGQRAASVSRSYQRIRDRVKNGVCPCCERTFQNLARHMQTKHPDFGNEKQLRTMRLAYGLTQAQLAQECGVSPAYVSLYERGMELPKSGQERLDCWIAEQSA